MLLNSQVDTFHQKAVSRFVVPAPAREDDRAGRVAAYTIARF